MSREQLSLKACQEVKKAIEECCKSYYETTETLYNVSAVVSQLRDNDDIAIIYASELNKILGRFNEITAKMLQIENEMNERIDFIMEMNRRNNGI